ncbi:DNA-binding protein [Endomicrobiia bacterium]|nr:DNA-binding protein [Endomicrobiia bacterium]GHT45549.1 DNA-binding protein [Endomicrobiia bacterium]
MANLEQNLDLLRELQVYDIKIDDIKRQISKAPLLIEEKNKAWGAKKFEMDAKKKNFVELNSLKKEKESLLDAKEKAIDKHSMELNTVKSNNTYNALLAEIEKAKVDKSVVEDELLELMDKIDKEFVVVKEMEKELKDFENKIKIDIREVEDSLKKKEEEISVLENVREGYKLKVNQSILSQYDRLRLGSSNGLGIALVDDESCGVCGMELRPQLINQTRKCHELVFCDNCSRILLKK